MRPIEVTKHVWVLGDQMMSHAHDCGFFLVMGARPVLIDCGCGEGHASLTRNLRRLRVSPGDIDCVICTHGHYDHTAGITRLRAENPEIRMAAHAFEADQIENGDTELTCAGWMFGKEIAPERVDVRFMGGETFEAGGLEFEIIHAPGHTRGSICVRVSVGGRRVLFTGDSMGSGNDRVGSDFEEWKRTLERLAELEFDLLLPGHLNQWVLNPYCATLAQPFSRQFGRKAFDFLMNHGIELFWNASVFQYSHVTPIFAKLT